MPDDAPCVLACGADIKSRFGLFKGGRLYLSEDHGDLSVPANLISYRHDIREICEDLGAKPDIIARDLHPAYFSGRLEDLLPGIPVAGIQHHLAHLASAMAGAGLSGNALGICFDGSGYGLDGAIWGGEFLVIRDGDCNRFGHLEYIQMPGGETAIREPWRMAFSILYALLGDGAFEISRRYLPGRDAGDFERLASMIRARFNSPATSSCGRLFDAVAALLGLAQKDQGEAEAAMSVERNASLSEDRGCYPIDIARDKSECIVLYRPLIEGILRDLENGSPKNTIARRFHNTLAWIIAEMAALMRESAGINAISLTGGVFQNRLLSDAAIRLLREKKFDIIESPAVPVSDLGLCVGQAFAAIHRIRFSYHVNKRPEAP